jgi:hypothetical protein
VSLFRNHWAEALARWIPTRSRRNWTYGLPAYPAAAVTDKEVKAAIARGKGQPVGVNDTGHLIATTSSDPAEAQED